MSLVEAASVPTPGTIADAYSLAVDLQTRLSETEAQITALRAERIVHEHQLAEIRGIVSHIVSLSRRYTETAVLTARPTRAATETVS